MEHTSTYTRRDEEKNNAHKGRWNQCSVTMDKNHPQCIQGPIDGLATDAGGSEPEGVTYKWIGDKRRVFSVCAKDIVYKMAATVFLIAAALLGHARAGVIDLKCSDNATCIEDMAKDFVRSIRQQKTMRIFDVLTIEPIGTRQARSNEGLLSRLLNNNAFYFDWNDYTFRLWKDQGRENALDFEVYEGRTAKGEFYNELFIVCIEH